MLTPPQHYNLGLISNEIIYIFMFRFIRARKHIPLHHLNPRIDKYSLTMAPKTDIDLYTVSPIVSIRMDGRN